MNRVSCRMHSQLHNIREHISVVYNAEVIFAKISNNS